jgi:hypothetical protein
MPSIFRQNRFANISSLTTLVHVSLTILLPQGITTAILVNPRWVVNAQTFTAPPNSFPAHSRLGSASPSIFFSLFSDRYGPCRRIPQAELSAQEMASSIPTVLTKIARFLAPSCLFRGEGNMAGRRARAQHPQQRFGQKSECPRSHLAPILKRKWLSQPKLRHGNDGQSAYSISFLVAIHQSQTVKAQPSSLPCSTTRQRGGMSS